MPKIILPFLDAFKKNKEQKDSCDVVSMLPKDFQQIAKNNPHLAHYLHMVPVKDLGIPQYYEKLDRSFSSNKKPNVIYPIKAGIYSHIIHDSEDGRNTYIPIEPTLVNNMEKIMLEVENRLVEMGDYVSKFEINNDADRKNILFHCLEKICSTSADSNKTHSKNPFEKKYKPIIVTPAQLRAIRYLLLRDKLGIGVLDPIVADKYVEDVSCSGMGPVFIEHKIFKSLKSVVTFTSHEDLDLFVMRLAEQIKMPVSVHNPIVDATLPDGSRINIVYGRDVSKRGSNFTIRKFSDVPLSIIELIEMGTLDVKMAAYLSLTIGEGMNVFVCGETASGKTTTLNAITTFIHPNSKIISIEDTPELQVPHSNWIREVVRFSADSDSSSVTMFDLLKAALRQRPNEIIIGEIRGEEGSIAFQAMQTGHSVMATFHAASVERLVQRLTGDPINVPKAYIDNLNLAIIQSAVKLPSGSVGRRMVSINEIVGYDSTTQSFIFVEVFRWDPATDTFQFSGDNNSYLLEYKIAPKLGIPAFKKRRIYAEIVRRAKVFERLKKEGVKNFYDVLKVLAKAQRDGLF